MALDPILSAGVQPVVLGNPMARYQNALSIVAARDQMVDRENKLAAMREAKENQNFLNEAFRKFTDAQGKTDYGALRGHLASSNKGTNIYDIEKQRADLAKTEAETREKETQARKQALESIGVGFEAIRNAYGTANTPEKALRVGLSMFDDDVLGPVMRTLGATPEQLTNEINNAVKTGKFNEWLQDEQLGAAKLAERMLKEAEVSLKRDELNEGVRQFNVKSALDNKKFGLDQKRFDLDERRLELDRQRLARDSAKSNESDTYTDAFSKKYVDKDIETINLAEKALGTRSRARRGLEILNSKNVISGSAANPLLELARAWNITGTGNTEKLANTEELIGILAQNTLDSINRYGVGARGMDTVAERQFLQDPSGRINMSPETLRRILTNAEKIADLQINTARDRVGKMPENAFKSVGMTRDDLLKSLGDTEKTEKISEMQGLLINAFSTGRGPDGKPINKSDFIRSYNRAIGKEGAAEELLRKAGLWGRK